MKKIKQYKKENKVSPVTSTALGNLYYDYINSWATTANGESFHLKKFGEIVKRTATGREGEERIQVKDSIPLSYAKEIMIPTKFKGTKENEAVLPRAKQLVPKITWYDSDQSIASQRINNIKMKKIKKSY